MHKKDSIQFVIYIICFSLLYLLGFLSEAASGSESSLSSSRLANNGRALGAVDNSGGMAIHNGNLKASGALDIHEPGVGALNKSLQLMLGCLILGIRVQEVLIHMQLHTTINTLKESNLK